MLRLSRPALASAAVAAAATVAALASALASSPQQPPLVDGTKVVAFFEANDLSSAQAASKKSYYPFLKVPALHCGIYALPKGATDAQPPHAEDEVYHVLSGAASISIGPEGHGESREVKAGSIIYVKANVPHRFHDIREDLSVLVFFASDPAKADGGGSPR